MVQEISFSDIPILSGLDKINLARLVPNFERLHVKSGEIILRHGEPWDALYIIVEGIVRVFLPAEGKTREIACLGPGDCFGEMALLTGEPGSANIEAMTDLSLLRLSKECFDQMIVVMLTAHAVIPEALKQSFERKAHAYIPKEKLGEIVPFLEDIFRYGYIPGWKRLLEKLKFFFDSKFTPGWEAKVGLKWWEWD
jgi:CRP-like cAMP-binding protein